MSDASTSDAASSDASTSNASASDAASEPPRTFRSEWGLPVLLFSATFVSTLYVGATMEGFAVDSIPHLLAGWPFAVPLMAILLAHEFGHYFAGKLHGVDISPPFFIPMPISLLGTMGAVIRMRGQIRSRNALLDIGAAGPLAGMVIALPVLVYGLATSPVEPMSSIEAGGYIVEGRSLLYWFLLTSLKGTIPAGHDIMLTSTALAGWAGLLVTMINLLPFGQLDGGHVSYALLGPKQDRISRAVLWTLPFLAVLVSVAYGVPSLLAHDPEVVVEGNLYAGAQWAVWALVLFAMTRFAGSEHPPTEDDTLSPRRRWVAIGTLALFALLFMPTWMRAFG